jgi:hypothetical protein
MQKHFFTARNLVAPSLHFQRPPFFRECPLWAQGTQIVPFFGSYENNSFCAIKVWKVLIKGKFGTPDQFFQAA